MSIEYECPKCDGRMIKLKTKVVEVMETSFMPKKYGTEPQVCTDCGFVEFYLLDKSFEKFAKKHAE